MKVCDVCDLVNGRAFKPSDWGSYGLPIVRIQNLNNEAAPFNYYSGEYNPAHEINNGELLFSWSGTPGTSFGAFRWYRGKGILNQHIYKVVPKIDIDKDYLKYALNGNLSRIISKAHGGVGLQHITKKELNEITLRIVSNDEQRKIVALLNQTQNVIFHRQAQLAKLDELVKCRFVEMFNCKMQADCNKILGDYAEVTGGFAFKSEKFEAEGVPIIRIGNIINNRVNLDEVVCYPEDFWEENSAYRVNCGDILMAMSGATTGKIGFCNSNSKLLLNQRVARIRTKPLFNYTAFLRAALEQDWMAEHILKTAYGCAQPNISAAEIRQLPMPDTTIESVQCFTSFIHRIDKLRFDIQKSLNETQKLFDSLMQEYFD